MKTIKDIEQEISRLISKGSRLSNLESNKKEKKKLSKKVEYLNKIKLFLLNYNDESKVKEEHIKLTERIKKIDSEFFTWVKANAKPEDTKLYPILRKEYNKIKGVSAIKRQLKNLDFILS